MELYLAGEFDYIRMIGISPEVELTRYTQPDRLQNDPKRINLLQSFYYARKNNKYPIIQNSNACNLLIDSGAFTFMQDDKYAVNWERYTDEYCDWVLANGIKNFVEMDIDWVSSVGDALALRRRIEHRTGMQPIPCWHTCRGKQAWIDICKEYPYASLSLGGATKTTSWFKQHKYEQLGWFLDIAAQYGCKVHGLGLTAISVWLKHRHRFYSCDSTAWLAGNLGGFVYRFNPYTGVMDKVKAPQGKKLKTMEAAQNNFDQWVLYQRWCRNNM